MPSNPPSVLSDLSDLLPGASAAIRAQAVLELVRLRQKLTPDQKLMSYFSRASVTRPMGRPLGQPVESFAALLYARLSGHSRKRAEELIRANPSTASGAVWAVASQAHADGVTTAEQFEQWLQKTEQESINS